jgi:phosphohistidine phosphatase
MRVLIVRHAIAEDKVIFARKGRPDSERALTSQGHRKMVKNAKGLRRLEPAVSLIATSPWLRAQQTAEVLSGELAARTEVWPELLPDRDLGALLRRLRKIRAANPVVLVGHEPHLSRALAWLCTGEERTWAVLRKGGACAIEFRRRVIQGQAELEWLLTPRQLRSLARSR